MIRMLIEEGQANDQDADDLAAAYPDDDISISYSNQDHWLHHWTSCSSPVRTRALRSNIPACASWASTVSLNSGATPK